MSYYAIFTDQSGIPGVPNIGDLKMYEDKISGNAFDKSNYIQYDWMKAGFPDYEMKNEFFLYSKEAQLNFDFFKWGNNFILSESFIKVLKRGLADYEMSPITILNAETGKEIQLPTQYFFVKFLAVSGIVNYDASVFEDSLTDKGVPLVYNGVRFVKRYDELVLNVSATHSDIFLIKDPILSTNLFCTEKFKETAQQADLKAVMFVPLAEYLDFKKYSGFLGKETYERLKQRDV